MSWWSSIEQLSRGSLITQWLIIGLSLLAAFSAVAKLIISNRLDDLRGERTREVSARLSEAQQKVEQLERDQQPRRLTALQHAKLVSELSGYRGQAVQIVLHPHDLESRMFAADLLRFFTDAGWNIVEGGTPSDWHSRAGIWIWYDPHSASEEAADHLIALLGGFGYTVNTSYEVSHLQFRRSPKDSPLIVLSAGRKKD